MKAVSVILCSFIPLVLTSSIPFGINNGPPGSGNVISIATQPSNSSDDDHAVSSLIARQSTNCFPLNLQAVGGSQTITYGFTNPSDVIKQAANACQSTTCDQTNVQTVQSSIFDLNLSPYQGFYPIQIQVKADGQFSSSAVRDFLFNAINAFVSASVTQNTVTSFGNTVGTSYSGSNTFTAQLINSCGGVGDYITVTAQYGSNSGGNCPSWITTAAGLIWGAISPAISDVGATILGGEANNIISAICSG
jgi:hypothetical protein